MSLFNKCVKGVNNCHSTPVSLMTLDLTLILNAKKMIGALSAYQKTVLVIFFITFIMELLVSCVMCESFLESVIFVLSL